MALALTSPVTGAAQTGLTNPTYTLVADVAPTPNGKQYAVSALGGTQTGVEIHSISAPFTVNMVRPTAYKQLGAVNPNTGRLPNVPRNQFSVITRKGVLPMADQPYSPMVIRTIIDVPAGADVADPESVRAALSLHIGALSQASAGIGDTTVSGV